MNSIFHKALWMLIQTHAVSLNSDPNELVASEVHTRKNCHEFSALEEHVHEELPPEFHHLIRGIHGFIELFYHIDENTLSDEASYVILFTKEWQILLRLDWECVVYVSLLGMVAEPQITQDQTDTSR